MQERAGLPIVMVTPSVFSPAAIAIIVMLAAVGEGFAADVMRPFSAQMWQKPSAGELLQRLSAEQYTVTQNEGTEAAFRNAYWDNKQAGIYVDIVSGEPLFSSLDQFSSGTGWPSFTRPISRDKVSTKVDWSPGFELIEVRSRYADSHLGQVFDDGPDAEGLRYCINSASLRFIRKDELLQQGYPEFLPLFER